MRFFPRTRLALKFLGSAFRADAGGLGIVGSPSPDSDYWYHGLGYQSAAGPNVSPASSLRLAAVFACTRVCAETLGSLPVGIFRVRKSGGRDPAPDHPAQELFLQPNPWQTGMEFLEMMQGHLELRGNAYALKIPGNGRAIDQLLPQHPDRVRVYLLPNGRLRYEITAYSNGQIDRYSQDEILHLRAWSSDGIMGMSTVSAGAETIGVGLAQQEHRARYFRNNAIPGMVLESVKLTDEAREEMTQSISEKLSGEGAFKVFSPPPGVTAKVLGLTNKDSQLLEASNATRTEVCGMWRVPPHKVGDLSRGTFSNIEQQNIEFATDCMRPRVVRIERRLDLQVVQALRAFESAMGDYFVGLNMDALFRGDMKSRYEAYAQALPWMLRNEMRSNEGLNEVDGLSEPLVPVNLETVDQAQKRSDAGIAAAQAKADAATGQDNPEAETPKEPGPEDEEQKAMVRRTNQLRAMAVAAGGRIAKREAKFLTRLVSRETPIAAGELAEFYENLAPIVAQTMAIPLHEAKAFCDDHATALMAARNRTAAQMVVDQFEEESPVTLAKLAIGDRVEARP
jgi:HK97 family phage portal protein